MNLSEERNYQKLLSTLEAMELSQVNMHLAQQYLDMTREKQPELLTQAEHQDFSRLDKEKCRKCLEYIEHCNKRGRKEEAERFIRFAAAAGGSTAYYVLLSYGWNLDSKQEFITRQQAAAIRAESIVWNIYGLKKAVDNIKEKNPEVLKEAMELCYHKECNSRVLLSGIYLYYTKPVKAKGGFFRNIFSKEETNHEVEKIVQYLENTIIDSIPGLFSGTAAQMEVQKLQEYLKDADIKAGFPNEILTILSGKAPSDYMITLLSGVSFLAVAHSDLFAKFICLASVMDKGMPSQNIAFGRRTQYQNPALDTCLEIGGKNWFSAHMEELEKYLPMSRENYLTWCLIRNEYELLGHAVKDYPEAVRNVAEKVSADEYQSLMSRVQRENIALYREMSSSYSGEFRMKIAEELTDAYTVGKNEAKQYLLGEAQLDMLYPFVDEWRKRWDYGTRRSLNIQRLKDNSQEKQMYRRAVVLEGLWMRAQYFCSYWHGTYRKVKRDEITGILKIFEEEKLPVRYQLESLSSIHDSFYQDKDKTNFINECVIVIRLKKKDWGEELAILAREGSAMVRFLCIRVLDEFWQENKEVLLGCSMDSSKQVRELLTAVYASHKEWEEDIKAMLTSKKSQEREIAVLVLKKWGVSNYRQEFETALAIEKSKKIKELLQSCLGIQEEVIEKAGGQTSEDLVKEILKGGKKRKVSWVWEAALPQVHKSDNTLASEDYLSAILVTYADMGIPGINENAEKLAKELNQEELSAFVIMIFGKWLEGNAEAKKKWVLYAASIHGGESIIPALYSQIQEWPQASRGAMAAEAVKALALNGSSTALLMVDQISRKFKFRQVKAAASEALSFAAKQLGITREELEDRIVPNLGFDERMEQIFDYGTRKFKVLLTPALELEIFDETGKKLKNLPSPGQKDEPEKSKAASDAFKLLKKQLKTVVTNQKLRLDQAMSTERMWPVEQWKELFVKNPVMHQFAMGLIWGLYDNGKLVDTFRYMEDGTFNTVDEDEYEFPASGMIGLVHPIELSAEDLKAWKEQLSDYEVTQPIEQLERPVYQMAEEEKNQKELTRFGGKLLNGLSLSGKLQGMGWYRGSVLDAGCYYTFYREDGKMGVELEFSGCYVGDENDEITVYGAVFYQSDTVKRGSYVYDAVKKENRYKLGEVSPRYFSEMVLQLTKATASSKEQLAYPECKKAN